MYNNLMKKKFIVGLVGVMIGVGAYTLGYLRGSGYFYEMEYNAAIDSTLDTTGYAPDAFMTEYTLMDWQGRDSYGNFIAIYKPTNKGEPKNTIVYTVFFEEDENENVIRLKIVDEQGKELVYFVKDYIQDGENVKIKEASEQGIVMSLTKRGGEYNIYFPITKAQKPVVVHGVYTLDESNTHVTDKHKTTGRDASEVMTEMNKNFTYVEEE